MNVHWFLCRFPSASGPLELDLTSAFPEDAQEQTHRSVSESKVNSSERGGLAGDCGVELGVGSGEVVATPG